jgi:uncharacterized protein YdeI (YjbR/CyaY-like superfamily)
MITQIDDYFTKGCGRCVRFATSQCSTQIWREGLYALRQICRASGLEETVKWGHPCYVRGDRNIALIGAFRGDFRINFMNASLLKDPHSVLEKQGENSQIAGSIRFSSLQDVADNAGIIRQYLIEAIGYADAGIKAPKSVASVDIPEELIAALDDDPELGEAFYRLTPGRQRSYAINLNGAKTSVTRLARIEKFRGHILAGKGAMER